MKYKDIPMFKYPAKIPDEDCVVIGAHDKFPKLGFVEAYFLDGQFWAKAERFGDLWPLSVTHWIAEGSTRVDDKEEWIDPKVLLPAMGERVIARNDFCQSESWIQGFNELGKPAWFHDHWEHADDFVTAWKRKKK